MKRVLFVEPRGAPSNVFAAFMTMPLLGPVYLATIAKQAGYDAEILNENILGRNLKPSELRADILCVSCLTPTIKRGIELAKEYKFFNPNGKTIVGGIHASMIPHDVAPYFDQVVVGEAENIILDILSGKIKDKIVYTEMPKDLDSFPLPDFKLTKDWQKIGTWPVMASRGCPYNCNFCSVTKMFGRGYRVQSPERVMREIMRYKRKMVFFSDDNFAADPERTDKLLNLMIESGFKREWSAQVRANVATKHPKLVAKMREANCIRVAVGFESINPKSLVEMNKNQTVEDIRRSIKVFHDNGIMVHGMFILGNDSDTKGVFKMTSDFCHDNDLDYVQYGILTPPPGTQIYSELEKQKRILHKRWEFYDGLHVVFKPKQMTADELQRGALECFGDFYSYTNAINDALNSVMEAGVAAVKNIYTKAHFPSIHPPFMKVVGRSIFNSWMKRNRYYLCYLKYISRIKTEGVMLDVRQG